MKSSTATKLSDIKREWHLVDIKDKTLGRISTEIAHTLMGKSKPYFVRNLDCGDYVVIINAKEVKISGKKETGKKYYRHSGYPGGFKSEVLGDVRNEKPEEIIRHAVAGMLPQNKLKAKMLKRLRVFAGAEHTFADKFKSSKVENKE
ncbi:50S ribosomal protein L13 [Patescibacteria group bacterium]|nr:50S ribosomal protein L13 [Patescibacteria group bacterium]